MHDVYELSYKSHYLVVFVYTNSITIKLRVMEVRIVNNSYFVFSSIVGGDIKPDYI